MITYISKEYLRKIEDLAKNFAENRSSLYSKNYRIKVYRSTYNVYYNIALFLYIRLNKISYNRTEFNFNRISSFILKKFSCKLYRKILDNLIENNIIVSNNHYSNFKRKEFSKSYLIHNDLLYKINESKMKFKFKLVKIELPKKVMSFFDNKEIVKFDVEDLDLLTKLNTFYRKKEWKNDNSTKNYYSLLNFDLKSLNEYCKEDEFLYNRYLKMLRNLKNDPKLIKSRFYHVFHEFPKDFREKVLKFEGENIKEIFDVSGSDLHMLAKHLETENIPIKELLSFQQAVKDDFRKLFGKKNNGKCTSYVKRAFKVYLNSKESSYSSFRFNSIAKRIDEYFKDNFPTIREYIIKHDDIWQISMNEEFDVMSKQLVDYLNRKYGIISFTCHDSIYVKSSVNIENIQEIFYDQLNLTIDSMKKLEAI